MSFNTRVCETGLWTAEGLFPNISGRYINFKVLARVPKPPEEDQQMNVSQSAHRQTDRPTDRAMERWIE